MSNLVSMFGNVELGLVGFDKTPLTAEQVAAQTQAQIASALGTQHVMTAGGYTTPTLAFNAVRRPSVDRDTLVVVSSRIGYNNNEEGNVQFQISPDNIAAYVSVGTVVRQWLAGTGGGGLLGSGVDIDGWVESSLGVIVPKGYYYKILTQTVRGTITYTMTSLRERLL